MALETMKKILGNRDFIATINNSTNICVHQDYYNEHDILVKLECISDSKENFESIQTYEKKHVQLNVFGKKYQVDLKNLDFLKPYI